MRKGGQGLWNASLLVGGTGLAAMQGEPQVLRTLVLNPIGEVVCLSACQGILTFLSQLAHEIA